MEQRQIEALNQVTSNLNIIIGLLSVLIGAVAVALYHFW